MKPPRGDALTATRARTLSLVVLVLVLVAALSSGAAAAEASDSDSTDAISESPWTMLMGGPTHNGAISAAIAGAQAKHEWAVRVGYDHTYYTSQPVAWQGLIYVAIGGYVDVPEFGADEYAVLALDVETGDIVWRHTLPGEATELALSPTRYSVFSGCRDGFLYALDLGTGAVDWKREIRPDVWSAPTVADDEIYVGSMDDELFCLRTVDGSTIWQTPLGGPAMSPVVAADAVYVTTTRGEALRLRRDDGAIVWRRALSGSCRASPSFGDGVLLCGSSEGTPSERGRLAALDGLTGERRWEIVTEGEVFATPAVRGGVVYYSADEMHAVRASDGSAVWSSPVGVRRQSPVVADDAVLVVSPIRGEIDVLDRATGGLLAAFCPAFFVGDATQIPLFLDYRVVIGCADGYIRCFRLVTPSITITDFGYTCVPIASVQTESAPAPEDDATWSLPALAVRALLLLAHALLFGVAMYWVARQC